MLYLHTTIGSEILSDLMAFNVEKEEINNINIEKVVYVFVEFKNSRYPLI